MQRRKILHAAATSALAVVSGMVAPRIGRAADKIDGPGVTAAEIKIGSTNALSGPASANGVMAQAQAAYFRMINDQGGVAGRKINFIVYDDGYSPPKAVEMVRRLVESDEVDCLFGSLGTPSNSAIVAYCNRKKVPHLFLSTGADKFGRL